VVLDDGPDVVDRRVGVEAEVEACLLRARLGATAPAAGAQVVCDDLWPLRRGQFLEVDAAGSATADDRMAVSCADVSHPLRLAGESDEVVRTLMTSSQDGHTTRFA
jgi:hypothetical protein